MKEINNNITESYCSFEVSKLLKEKGFDCYTTTWHQRGSGIVEDVVGKLDRYNSKGEVYTSHPTQALAQKWLREKHSIHIDIMPVIIPSNEIKYYVYRGKKSWDWSELYNTYEEATEAALLYALKNFINEKTE